MKVILHFYSNRKTSPEWESNCTESLQVFCPIFRWSLTSSTKWTRGCQPSLKNQLKVFSTSHSSLIRWLRLKWWSLRSHYQRTLVQIPEDVEAAFSSTLKLENVLVYGGMYPVIRGLDTSLANKLASSK